MPRPMKPLTAQQELYIRLSAQGKTRPEIMKAVFNIDMETADHNVINAADQKLFRWRKRPEFETIWKDEVRSILYGCTAKAIQVINSQMDEDIPWLRNKAANDLMNYGKQQIYGDEERAIHVKVEGMPDIGSPDD